MNECPHTAATASALPGIARPARRSLGRGRLRTSNGRAAFWERRAPSRRPCRSGSRHTHNTLGGGVIGHILRNRRIDTQTYAATDKWFHYDQVGSVLAETNALGASVSIHHPDSYGNRMSSWQTGLWGTSWAARAGWGHNTKELMADTGLVYMYQRWYNPETGTFLSRAPYPPMREHAYGFGAQTPSASVDPNGEEVLLVCLAVIGVGSAVISTGPKMVASAGSSYNCMKATENYNLWMHDARLAKHPRHAELLDQARREKEEACAEAACDLVDCGVAVNNSVQANPAKATLAKPRPVLHGPHMPPHGKPHDPIDPTIALP